MWQLLLGLAAAIPFFGKKAEAAERSKTVIKDGAKITATIQPEGATVKKKTVQVSPNEIKTVIEWTPPPAAKPYLALIEETEKKYKIPDKLLARLLYQESRFRPDIIKGDLVSSAGAVGIAQIVPKWHPGVNPRDPKQAIPYAGKYLRDLYNMFGSWDLALKAYNWGPTSVKNWRDKGADITKVPKETLAYSSEILRDIQIA